MSDATDTEYIVEYLDGPLAGQTERRFLIGGRFDEYVDAMVAVEGMETLLRYIAVADREVQGEQHVQYRFDSTDSDPIVEDREDGSGTLSEPI
ncbi:MAG: hypothetical protein ABI255_06185 [Microbacteriaceae bacterium]